MFRIIGLFGAAALSAAVFSVEAEALTLGSPSCASSTISSVIGGSYKTCYGSYAGNDSQAATQPEVLALLNGTVNSDLGLTGTWATDNADKSDSAGSGVFTGNPGNNSGTLTFDSSIMGIFGVILKAGPRFSMFIFDGGNTGISSFDFTTTGVAVNNQGKGKDLSHASYFSFDGGPATVVPLPATLPLLVGGLGILGFMGRRRNRSA